MSCPLLLPSNSPFTGLKWFDCGIGCSMISAFGTPLLLHPRTRWRHLWTIWKASILHWSSAIAVYRTHGYVLSRSILYIHDEHESSIPFFSHSQWYGFVQLMGCSCSPALPYGDHEIAILCFPTAERESNTSNVNSLAPWGSSCCLCNRSWTVTTLVHSGSDCTCCLRLWNSLPNAKFGNF